MNPKNVTLRNSHRPRLRLTKCDVYNTVNPLSFVSTFSYPLDRKTQKTKLARVRAVDGMALVEGGFLKGDLCMEIQLMIH